MSTDSLSTVGFWLVLVVAAVFTMAFKLSFVEAFKQADSIPPWLSRGLRHVPPAVIGALVAPAFFAPNGTLVSSFDPRLAAGVVAGLVAWRTESVLATLAVGMGALWAFELAGLV